ncbi:MAG: VCBS repeat-containing protein, partial [Acidobacteriota bacterium]
MKKNIRRLKNSLRSPAGGGLPRALAFTLVALLVLGIGSGAAASNKIRLGYVDALEGPQAAEAEARLAALNEAVFLFEYYNQDTRVQLHAVDIHSPSLIAELKTMDAIVAGRGEDLDSLIAARSVVVTGEAFAAPSSATAEGLVDSVTAFIEGSAGLIVDSVGDSIAAREWVPPEIVAIEPNSAAPDEAVSIKFRNAGYMRAGDFRVRFSHVSGDMVLGGTIEPLINLEDAFRMEGYKVGVPHGAVSGTVEFQLPSQGTPAISRSLQSPELFEVQAIAPPPDDEIPVPVPSSCDSVSWHRLGSPNFFSEVADSKDLVISDVDRNGRPDVFIPQTNSKLDMLYKHLGNDAAGLPNFATIISGLVTNDVTPKRQYGVAAGDLDGDLYPEMIPTGATPQDPDERLRILVNNRNLTFTNQASSLITNWDDIKGSINRWDEAKIIDIDGDGDPDFALANRTS